MQMLKTISPIWNNTYQTEPDYMSLVKPGLIETVKHTHAWICGELSSAILINNSEQKVVLSALHPFTRIKSFQSGHSATFCIVEGKLRIHTRNGSTSIEKGKPFTLLENINYQLTTKEETMLLLILIPSLLHLNIQSHK